MEKLAVNNTINLLNIMMNDSRLFYYDIERDCHFEIKSFENENETYYIYLHSLGKESRILLDSMSVANIYFTPLKVMTHFLVKAFKYAKKEKEVDM